MSPIRDAVLMVLGAILMCLMLSLSGCGDDEPSAAELCAKSCEERGGEFYQMQGEYCYCAWTQ